MPMTALPQSLTPAVATADAMDGGVTFNGQDAASIDDHTGRNGTYFDIAAIRTHTQEDLDSHSADQRRDQARPARPGGELVRVAVGRRMALLGVGRQVHVLLPLFGRWQLPSRARPWTDPRHLRPTTGSSIASAGGAGGETDGTPRDDTELQMLEALHRASDKSLLSAKDKRKSKGGFMARIPSAQQLFFGAKA